jgi:pimeloyl-ACP methyl ester carboxylesterase
MLDTATTCFVDTGAVRFEVDVCGDPASERLALLLHGFPESSYSWRHQLPLLARLGYLAWAPNQRGYGHTTRFAGADNYRLELLVDDVGRLIDASGRKSVTLIGHDWGGIVAWMSALTAIRPLERLVVMNLPHPTSFRRNGRTWAQFRRSWYILFFQFPWLPEKLLAARGAQAIREAFRGMAIDKSRFPDAVLDVYARQALEPGALTAMVNWYRAMRRMDPALQRLIENPPILEVPTLMIWGEHDTALGKELTFGTEKLVRDFTIHYLPDVSHWVQQEAPERVNALLEEWLLRP